MAAVALRGKGRLRARSGAGHIRGDIEGLRALSVLLVIASHLIGAPAGGFVGVDIFFVISGFLITGMLVHEHATTGRISFRNFYVRRFRRIAPAAAVTLAVTCLAARLIFLGARAHQSLVDALWAALSLANWHMASIGTDYFQSGRPPSVVQHYWSLSVEEQFYLVWPMLIAATGWAVHRRSKGRGIRTPLAVLLGVATALSFGWSMHQSEANPTIAYFSTFTRAWELGAGALLALLGHRSVQLPSRAAHAVSALGIALILLSCVLITPQSVFPAPWALMPVLGAIFVIATGPAAGGAPHLLLLTNPVSRYVGRISYSLYLWHWPVLIILPSVLPKTRAAFVPAALAIVFAVSVASYHWVENPVRRSTWLDNRRGSSARSRLSPERVAVAALMSISVAAFAGTAAIQLHQAAASVPARPAVAIGTTSEQPAASAARPSVSAPTAVSQLATAISTSLSMSDWPALSPAPDQLDGAKAPEWSVCGNVSSNNEGACRFGPENAPASRQAVVLGDSIAISWLPGIRRALEPKGWRIQGLTWGQCPAPRIQTAALDGDKRFTKLCSEHQRWALAEAIRLKPALVIMASAENSLRRLSCCSDLLSAELAWQDAQQAAAKRLAEVSRVVILAPPPEGKSLADCATRLNHPDTCVTRISDQWQAMSIADSEAARAAGVTHVDTSPWFCDRSQTCPSFVGKTTVFADGTHLTSAYSAALAPQLANSLLAAKG